MAAWNKASVHSELMRVFERHVQTDVVVKESSHIIADLAIDSLGVMEVVADLEDAFALQISDDALREIETVGDVANAINAKLAADGRLEG